MLQYVPCIPTHIRHNSEADLKRSISDILGAGVLASKDFGVQICAKYRIGYIYYISLARVRFNWESVSSQRGTAAGSDDHKGTVSVGL